MDINGAYPSKYLKSSDLQEREITITMSHVEVEDVGGKGDQDDVKPVLYFEGKTKGFVLNKTNASTIAGLYGPETNNWTGQQITLFPTQTEFAGKPVQCIRVKMIRPRSAAAVEKVRQAVTVPEIQINEGAGTISDDDIPFTHGFSPCMV